MADQQKTPEVNPLDAFNAELDARLSESNSVEQPERPQNPITTMAPQAPLQDAEGEEAPKEATPKKSLLSKAGDFVKGFAGYVADDVTSKAKGAAAIATGAARIPGQAAGAAVDTLVDVTDAIHDSTILPLGEWLNKGPERFPGQKAIAASMLSGKDFQRTTSFADVLSARKYLGSIGYQPLNQGVAEMGSLVLGTVLAAEATPLKALSGFGKAGQVGKYAIAGGAAGAGLMDPHAYRVSTMMKDLGVQTEFTDWLANNDPKQESMLEGRFKNGLEAAGLGAATDAVFLGGKYLYTLAKASLEAAQSAKAAAAAAFKEIIPPGAQPGEMAVAREGGTITANGEPAVQFADEKAWEKFVKAARGDTPEEAAAAQGTKEAIDDTPLPPLNDPANVAPMLREMAIALHDTPHVVKPDEQMHARAASIAKEVGVAPQDLLMAAEQISGKMTDIDSAVTAMRGAWGKITRDLDPFANRGVDAIAEEELPALKQAIHNAITYSGYFANIRSQSGRLLRSLGLEDLEGYLAKGHEVPTLGEFVDHPVKPLPQTRQEIGDFLEMWRDTAGDPGLRQDFLQGVQNVPGAFKYFRTSLANWFTASALSGLPSLGMNIVGPGIVGALHTVEKTFGGAVAAMLERDPGRRADLVRTSANAARAYFATIGDIPNVMRHAIQAMKQNRSVLGGGGTVNDISTGIGPITPAMIRSAKGQDAPTWGYALGNAINLLPRQFQRLNAGLDEFAKRLSYNGEVRLQAMVDAGKQGLRGDDFRAFVKKAMQESIDEVSGEALDDAALRSAERTTLTGSLTGNEYHPLVGKGADWVNSLRREVPEFRFIAPVFNVPANSVGETLRRIPALNFLLGETRDELLGNLGAVRQADAYGRTLMGGMFMLWAYSLARNGELTGAGPQDARDRKTWELNHQPYSIKVGDKWISYARYDLPGSLLAIPATLYDKTVNRNASEDWEMAMLAGTGALAQYFKDKAALQGVSQMMDFGAAPSSDLAYFERTVGNVGARMAVPNFVTQMGRNVIDPQRRQRASIGDYITDALPWKSKELDPVRNVLGEPQFKPNQTLIENAVPITITSSNPDDPVITELDRLYNATGYGGGVTTPAEVAGGSPANGYFDPREIVLENGRSLFDAVIEARSLPNAEWKTPSVRGRLKELFESEEYQEATDGDANSMFDTNGNISKAALVKQVFSEYNREAMRKVATESPIARKYLAAADAKRINGATLRGYTVQKLVDAPELLQSLDINIEDFEDRLQ